MKRSILPYIVAWMAQGVLGFFLRWSGSFFIPQFSQDLFTTMPPTGKIVTYAVLLLVYGVFSFMIFRFVVDQIVIPNVHMTENPKGTS